MKENPASPKNSIFTPSGTSISILLTHHYNEVSLLSLSWIGTSRVSTPSTKMTPWLSPLSLQTSWYPRSSSTKEVPLISYIGKLSRDSRSPPTLSTLTSVHSSALQARVEARGYVDLMTTFDQDKLSRSFTIRYLLVDADTSYFSLISRKTFNELGAIVSTPHLKMKFPILTGEIVTIKADQKQA